MIIIMMMIACFREPTEVPCPTQNSPSASQEGHGGSGVYTTWDDIGGSGSLGSWTSPFTGGSGDYEFRWPKGPAIEEVPFDPDQMEKEEEKDTATPPMQEAEQQKCYR